MRCNVRTEKKARKKARKKQEKNRRCKNSESESCVVFILGKKVTGAKEIQSAPPKSRREKETMLGCKILGIQKIKA